MLHFAHGVFLFREDLAFFDLLAPLSNFWHIIVLINVTALSASTVDTLQGAIASVISSDIIRSGLSDKATRWISRFLLILINVPAIILSSYRFNVIGLFLVADLVCATAVLPVFLGLITKDLSFIPAPTELGAFLGILSGIAAVVVNGQVIGFDQAVNSITGEVIASGPFSYFWLTNSSQCALCGTTTMVTFIVVPLVAGFCALLFSKLDILIRGDRAREPIFKFAQPQEKKETQLDNEDESEEHAAPASDKEYEEFESHIYGGGTESDNMKDETDLAEDKNSQSVDVAA
jgi:SSS family solute:Na+ symporter